MPLDGALNKVVVSEKTGMLRIEDWDWRWRRGIESPRMGFRFQFLVVKEICPWRSSEIFNKEFDLIWSAFNEWQMCEVRKEIGEPRNRGIAGGISATRTKNAW
jgi:hypothetical protein